MSSSEKQMDLLLPPAVKEKSVLLLGNQIPFMVQMIRPRAVTFSSFPKTNRGERKADFFVTNSTIICLDHFKNSQLN